MTKGVAMPAAGRKETESLSGAVGMRRKYLCRMLASNLSYVFMRTAIKETVEIVEAYLRCCYQ